MRPYSRIAAQSPFKNTMPPAFAASASSNLVRRTFSRLLKVSKCCSPTAVITAWSGFTRSQISLISPTRRAPISQTKTSCDKVMLPRTNFTMPIGVLQLPGGMRTLYLMPRSDERKYFMLVFP